MKIAVFAIGFLLGGMAMSQTAHAGFPADGKFKMQPIQTDHWYFYDEIHWYIKAPDKWQHLMGSYASTKIFNKVRDDKLSAATAVFLGGILKELDDGLREGWSIRDLLMDALGVTAAALDKPGLRLVGTYDSERFLITLNIAL